MFFSSHIKTISRGLRFFEGPVKWPVLIFLLSSCLLPKPPGPTVIEDYQRIETVDGSFDLYTITPRDLRVYRSGRDPWNYTKRKERNLLFIAVDETVQEQFQAPLQAAYQTDRHLRIEDLSWWRFAPQFRGLYHQVLKISHNSLKTKSLNWALDYMESKGKDFDVFLLTHGIPNHITASKGQHFISYSDLEKMGPFRHLDFVFMQGCFSETLASDWIKMGAKETLSYEGWNRNFFYVDFFLPEYRKTKNVKKSFDKVNRTIQKEMRESWLYDKILAELGLTLEEYFQISPNPIYDSRTN